MPRLLYERVRIAMTRILKRETWTRDVWSFVLSIIAAAVSVAAAVFAFWSYKAGEAAAYLAHAQVRPILAFEWNTPVRGAKRHEGNWTIRPDSSLVVHNVGALAIQRPRVEVMTIAVFAERDSGGGTDRFARLPVTYWFARHKHVMPAAGRGPIAILGTEDDCAALPIWTRTSASEYPLRRLVSLLQLVVLHYRDALQEDEVDYYIVSPWDYALISDEDGRRLWMEMSAKLSALATVHIANKPGQTLSVDSLAQMAFECRVREQRLKVPIFPDSLDPRRYPGYPPREKLRVRSFL